MEQTFSFSVLIWKEDLPATLTTCIHADYETCLALVLSEAETALRRNVDRVTLLRNHRVEEAQRVQALVTKVA